MLMDQARLSNLVGPGKTDVGHGGEVRKGKKAEAK